MYKNLNFSMDSPNEEARENYIKYIIFQTNDLSLVYSL
jgi:hypothetical protein